MEERRNVKNKPQVSLNLNRIQHFVSIKDGEGTPAFTKRLSFAALDNSEKNTPDKRYESLERRVRMLEQIQVTQDSKQGVSEDLESRVDML